MNEFTGTTIRFIPIARGYVYESHEQGKRLSVGRGGRRHCRAHGPRGQRCACDGQAPPDPPCPPRIIVDFCSDVRAGRSFLLDKGGFTTFEFPGASLTVVLDINNRGQMVGTYVDAQGPTPGGFTHGLDRRTASSPPSIPVPGPLETEIFGINERGQMVGAYLTPRNHARVPAGRRCLYADRAPGAATETVLFDINNRGQILGGYVDAGGTRRSFVLDDGVFTTSLFPAPRGPRASTSTTAARSWASTSMRLARATGSCWTKAPSPRSTSLDDSGPQPTQIVGINNRGQMVGVLIDAGGVSGGF